MTESTKYPLMMRLFHWTMSIIIIGLIILGFLMQEVFTDEPFTGAMFTWHKSFGVLVLILITLRLFTRYVLRKQVPPMIPSLTTLERWAAVVGHKLLYLLMIIVPVSGYLMSSAFPKSSGIALFGIPLPDALPKSDAVAQVFTLIHQVSAYTLAAVIVLHVAAVIKHRYFDNHPDDILKRMW
jgi:cytochrome b561